AEPRGECPQLLGGRAHPGHVGLGGAGGEHQLAGGGDQLLRRGVEVLLGVGDGHSRILSMIAPVAWAPPVQIATIPNWASRRSSSSTTLAIRRMPVAPTGWPIAIAPPLTLSRSGSTPCTWANDIGTAAKASLTSTTAISSIDMPVRRSSRSAARTGPSSR